MIRLAYGAMRFVYRTFGARTEGARAVVLDADGRILLVRARYGRRDRWQFPGGGIDRGERPVDAAVRETREEAGITLTDPRPVGRFARRDGRWRDTVHLFVGRGEGTPRADGREIAEAEWFAPGALPPVTRATRRRLRELGSGEPPPDFW